MCRIARIGMLVLVAAGWITGPAEVAGRVPRVFESIAPLQWLDEMGVPRNHCTAWSVSEARGLWITAGHCVTTTAGGEEGDQAIVLADRAYLLAQAPAHVVVLDLSHDLALLEGVHRRALPVSDREVRFSDEVRVAGHPFGETRPVLFHGRIAAIETDGDWMGLDVEVCGGNSGSPVLNKQTEVVSVVQISAGRPCGHYTGGVRQDALRAFVARWVARPDADN